MAVRWVSNQDVRRWQAAADAGASVRGIARNEGRSWKTVRHYISDPIAGLRRRALRDERLFAACNRALAEVRA